LVIEKVLSDDEIFGNKHFTFEKILNNSIASVHMREIPEDSTENIALHAFNETEKEGQIEREVRIERGRDGGDSLRSSFENVSNSLQNSRQIL
jgi:hypothetical protein